MVQSKTNIRKQKKQKKKKKKGLEVAIKVQLIGAQ